MSIDWHRPEFTARAGDWKLIDDMCDETNLAAHLPELNPADTSPENKARNEFYRDRASFFGASRVTLQALVGMAFEKDPQIALPADLQFLLTNCDGAGADLWQQMQAATGQVLRKGRAGLFVTMPPTTAPTSRADQEAGKVAATIHLIDARRIINWWTRKMGAETVLAGVVFTDAREAVDDYEVKTTDTRRELALDDAGFYFDRTWIKDAKGVWQPEAPIYPTTGTGGKWTRIPFLFVGVERNSWDMQTPPMLSLARLNRAHYRNSADNEESLWYAGQVQPYIEAGDSGAVQADLDALKTSGFYVGSRQVILGKFGFAQAEANTALRQAMLDKREEMAAIGARFVEEGSATKTATQAAGEEKVAHSVLSLVSVNVEDAYQWACEQAAAFMRASGAVEIALDRSFMDPQVTSEKMREMRENVLSGLAPYESMYLALVRNGDLPPETTLDQYRAMLDATGVTAGGNGGGNGDDA